MMRQKIPVIAAKARHFFLFFFLINSVSLFHFHSLFCKSIKRHTWATVTVECNGHILHITWIADVVYRRVAAGKGFLTGMASEGLLTETQFNSGDICSLGYRFSLCQRRSAKRYHPRFLWLSQTDVWCTYPLIPISIRFLKIFNILQIPFFFNLFNIHVSISWTISFLLVLNLDNIHNNW